MGKFLERCYSKYVSKRDMNVLDHLDKVRMRPVLKECLEETFLGLLRFLCQFRTFFPTSLALRFVLL